MNIIFHLIFPERRINVLKIFTDLFHPALELDISQVCIRLLCALIVGVVIGTEREYTHRPAGMRTHMLVSLGACVVMITGQLIFIQYQSLGATPDPARLGAQVITGVGFLGAGTIMREGPTVKGLTTAASLWATACLGLAAGSGYYVLAIAGMVFIFVTLTIFEVIQKKLLGVQRTSDNYVIKVRDISCGLHIVNENAKVFKAIIQNIETEKNSSENFFTISFRADFSGRKGEIRNREFFEAVACSDNVLGVHITGEYSGVGIRSKS